MSRRSNNDVWKRVLYKYCCEETIGTYEKLSIESREKMVDALKSTAVTIFANMSSAAEPRSNPRREDQLLLAEALEKTVDISANFGKLENTKECIFNWGSNHTCHSFKVMHSYTIQNYKERSIKPLLTHDSTIANDSSPCITDFSQLTRICFRDLKLFETAKGKYVECKTITNPCVPSYNIVTYIEDENEHFLKLTVNNFIPNNVDKWKYAEEHFPKNLNIKIPRPLYKIFMDGCVGIRVDTPNQIYIDKEDPALSFQEVREKGKELVKSNDLLGALELYITSARKYTTVIELLNNRSQTEIKLGEYEEALLDAAAILLIQPDNEKARLRYNKSLIFLGYKGGDKTSNALVWKKVLQKLNFFSSPQIAQRECSSKETGNIAHQEGRYSEAKAEYTLALNQNHEISTLLNNIAVVYNKLQVYQSAISAASACLRITIGNETIQRKACYSMTNSFSRIGEKQMAELIGQSYPDLCKKFYEGEKNPADICLELLQKRIQHASTLSIDCKTERFKETYSITKDVQVPGDFVHPNTIKHAYVTGKGRGVIAQRFIKCGELILIDHPIQSPTSKILDNCVSLDRDINSSISAITSQIDLKKTILALIRYDGLLAKKLSLLETKKCQSISEEINKDQSLLIDLDWIGYHNLCHHISPFLPQTPKEVGVDIGYLTEGFVKKVVEKNCFSCPVTDKSVHQLSSLYLNVSLFNHDKFPNCGHVNIGNAKVVQAIRDIYEGEELTISYGEGEILQLRWGIND